MSGIDRRGQKVECVIDPEVWSQFCCDFTCCGPPLLGAIYTVRNFADIEGHPGIYLHELPGVTCPCHDLINAPWPLCLFLLLDTHETDIGALTRRLELEDVA